MSIKSRFRPTIQTLESRQLMAGDVGFEQFAATPEEPARENTTVIATTISGNTANSEGGGLWNDANGTMTITGTTIDGNTANSEGGGILNDGGILLEVGSTPGNGGGLHLQAAVITSPGPGGGPHVKVFDGAADPVGGGPQVRVFDVVTDAGTSPSENHDAVFSELAD